MTITSSNRPTTLGHIYYQALWTQLEKIGQNLAELRKASCKDVQTVAEAINVRTDVLLRIESGRQDFRLKTLFALCDYYNVKMESIVNQGQLISFKIG